MKKILILTAVFSLIVFSGCNFFSGKNSKIDDQALTKAEVQNEPSETDLKDVEDEPYEDIKDTVTSTAIDSESSELKLAKCLTEKGVQLYTSSTCPHCKAQKELFKDGVQYLDNIECLGMDGWTQVCKDKEINAVPTWIFADGQKLTGTTPLETLAAKTNCEYNPATI